MVTIVDSGRILMPSFSAGIADQTYQINQVITSLQFPEATGGDSPLTYALTPTVPGLTYLTFSRLLIGVPTAIANYDMTYTVTDSDGDTASIDFTISVVDTATPVTPPVTPVVDTSPVFSSTVPDREYDRNIQISLQLPLAAGGNIPLAYSLSPSVTGLTFNPSTRRLNGVTSLAGTTAMTYTVTDDDGDTDTISFNITVRAAPAVDTSPVFSGTVVDRSFQIGVFTAIQLPDATNGNTPLTYAVSPAIPGMSFDSSNFLFSGTPTTAGVTDVVYRVTDADGDTDTETFTITVVSTPVTDTTPTFNGTVSDRTYQRDSSVTLQLPDASGGEGILSYTLDPNIPGLNFDNSQRRLTGSPTALGATSMTYTVIDQDNDSSSLTFLLTITAPPPPDTNPVFSGTVADRTYQQNSQVNLQLPFASGGNGNLTYSLTPGIPGLNFDTSTLRLSGTAQTVGVTNLTYRVTDSDGDTDTISFTITIVVADLQPAFTATVSDQTFTVGDAVDITLPDAAGGNAPVSYAIEGLAPGLSFASSRITGNVGEIGSTVVTYTATDSDGDKATLSFAITVLPMAVSTGPVLKVAWLIEVVGTEYLYWQGDHPLTFNGKTYLGRNFLSLSDAETGVDAAETTMTASFAVANPVFRAELLQDPGPLTTVVEWIFSTDAGQTWAKVPRKFVGSLSNPVMKDGIYSIEIETYAADADRGAPLFWSHEDQQLLYPDDFGHEYMRQLEEGIEISWPP